MPSGPARSMTEEEWIQHLEGVADSTLENYWGYSDTISDEKQRLVVEEMRNRGYSV